MKLNAVPKSQNVQKIKAIARNLKRKVTLISIIENTISNQIN